MHYNFFFVAARKIVFNTVCKRNEFLSSENRNCKVKSFDLNVANEMLEKKKIIIRYFIKIVTIILLTSTVSNSTL